MKTALKKCLTIATMSMLAIGLGSVVARAQACGAVSPIAADRPGTLGGPLIVPMGMNQIETGWAMVRTSEGTAHAVGTTMLRHPVSCRLELRVNFGGYALQRVAPGDMDTGLLDGHVSMKLQVLEGRGLRPYVSVLVGSTVPVGGAFSHRHMEPESDIAASWLLPFGQAFTTYGGYASRVTETTRTRERLAGANWSTPIGSRVAMYFDVSQVARDDEHGTALAGGIQFFPHQALQLDVFVGAPVHSEIHEKSFGAGVARRF